MIVLTPLEAWVESFRDPNRVFNASAALLGVGQLITTLEFVSARRELDGSGVYPWPVMRLTAPPRPAALRRARDALFGRRGMVALLALRLLSAATLVFAFAEWTMLVAVLVLATLLLSFSVRLRWGQEAADDLSVQVALGLAAFAVCRSVGASSVGLYYIAAFSALAYVTAGATKLVESTWRNGVALGRVVNLRSFGAPWAADLLQPRPRLRLALSWAVMLAEMCFPLAVFLPAGGVVAVLAAGLLFHLALAVCMGLNTFVWAFLASYPAILLVWTDLHP